MLAPITPLLVEEAWEHAPSWLKEDPKVQHPLHQLYADPLLDPSRLSHSEQELRRATPVLMDTHGAIKAAAELARADKLMGSSLGCSVILEVPEGDALSDLRKHKDELEAMFVVSSVGLNASIPAASEWSFSQEFETAGVQCKAWVLPPVQAKCPRCWRYVAPAEDTLCGRCEDVARGRRVGVGMFALYSTVSVHIRNG